MQIYNFEEFCFYMRNRKQTILIGLFLKRNSRSKLIEKFVCTLFTVICSILTSLHCVTYIKKDNTISLAVHSITFLNTIVRIYI